MTKAQFARLSAFDKGVACYLLGARDDEPNVPESWKAPSEFLRLRYEAGERTAVMSVIDGDDE